jgi:hypothetical protein
VLSINSSSYLRRSPSRIFIVILTSIMSLNTLSLCQQAVMGSVGHATLDHRADGTILLSVNNGSWPEVQVLNRLRREYGWIIDYEQEAQVPDAIVTRPDGRLQPKPHSVSVSIPQAVQGSSAEEFGILTALGRGLSDTHERANVLSAGGDGRFDFVFSSSNSVPILSTVISIPSASRSVEETINVILQAVSARTSQHISRGGMADSSLETTQVSVGGNQASPARLLLAQALDALPTRHVWLLTYEPQERSYVFGVEPVVRAVRTASGQMMEIPVKTSSKQ